MSALKNAPANDGILRTSRLISQPLNPRRLLACTPSGVDANDQYCESIRLESGFFRTATIGTSTDVDMYEIRTGTSPGTSLDFTFAVEATNGSGLDSFLRLFDSNGNPVLDGSNNPIEDDDSGSGLNPRIDVTLPSTGTYYLGVSAFTNTNYDAEDGTGDTSSTNSTVTGSFIITGE